MARQCIHDLRREILLDSRYSELAKDINNAKKRKASWYLRRLDEAERIINSIERSSPDSRGGGPIRRVSVQPTAS